MKSKIERRIEFVSLISELIRRARSDLKIQVVVFWFHRTEDQQRALYAIGRTIELHRKPVTGCDGIVIKSDHQEWEAADLCIIDLKTGEWQWERTPEYNALGRLGMDLGLAWGGDWDGDGIRDPNDFDCFHFEYKETS